MQLGSSVQASLASAGADLLRARRLGAGLALAQWGNSVSEVDYAQPAHHTLSLYLTGGAHVERTDRRKVNRSPTRDNGPKVRGGPDTLFVLPAGHESRWRIGSAITLFHCYIDQSALAQHAVSALDRDPRHLCLMESTFSDDATMAMIVRGGILPLDWDASSDQLALDCACHLLVHHLLRHYSTRQGTAPALGGLAPAVRRRLAAFIDAHLHEPLSLEALAGQAGLSPYHFARMFRTSFGVPPHRYVAARRLAHAMALLRDARLSLAEVALSCGYGSQSHFSRVFRLAVGTTPGHWRKLR